VTGKDRALQSFRRKIVGVNIIAVVLGAALMAAGVGHFIASSLQLLELQSEVNE
jgi:hypothetical protein